MTTQNPKVWPVTVTFHKTFRIYVEAETKVQAQDVGYRAAENMDLGELSVGTEMDGWKIAVAELPTNLQAVAALNDDDYVWRDGKEWALCDTAGDRLYELTEAKP